MWNKSTVILRNVRGRKGEARSDVFVHVYEAEDRAPTFILVVWANALESCLHPPDGWTCYVGELAPKNPLVPTASRVLRRLPNQDVEDFQREHPVCPQDMRVYALMPCNASCARVWAATRTAWTASG